MLKSMIITAFRNIFRNRSFSLINLVGLSVSMSLGMLIILIVKEQYTFDNFHRDVDRIYRVNTMALRTGGGGEPYASTPLPIGQVLKDDYSFTESVVRVNRSLRGDAVYGNVNVPLQGLMVDPSFLEVFSFPLEKGNPSTVLTEPNSLVLTQEAAEKIFGKKEPLGQTMTLKGFGEFVVTGVLQKFNGKTHFEFEALASLTALPKFEADGVVSASLENWNNYYRNYVYFKLRDGRSTDEVEKALAEISKKQYAGLKLETRDRGYEFYLHPLTKITPGPELSNQMGNGLPEMVGIFMSVLAAIVMIMACFNYTNLMIAKSLSRAREIGVRKVVGAQRWQVFMQFIGETIVFSLVALVFSYLLLQFLKPAFMQLHITQEFSVNPQEDMSLYGIFLFFAVAVGIVAGLLPAAYLSAFRPAKVLKDAGNLKIYSKLTFRKVLMVVQFTLSIVFVIVVMVIYRQIDFMVSTDYGINDKNILNVRLQGTEFQQLANELAKVPGVLQVGGISHALGTWADGSSDYKRSLQEEPFVMREFIADENYLVNIEVKFLAGGNFDHGTLSDREKHIILNEQALKLFGFADPVSAIGQSVYVNDSIMLVVKGVVKDFNFRPLNYTIGPLAFRYVPSQLTILSAAILPSQCENVLAALGPIWKKLDPIHPLEYKMMEEEIDQAYVDAGFTDILAIIGYITFLAICLACLGMLGMAMYASETRVKEIGVRKVMGASVSNIAVLLSRSFLMMIGVAIVIGTPISLFMSRLFLDNYAYKTEITPGLVFIGISVIVVLGMITICSQTVRAAVSNPVKSLRYE
ncbi:MAG: ABC transporter permease [Bacteroidia bacterium]|nr:ABC transporter permease [Bacteroidia bacterium]